MSERIVMKDVPAETKETLEDYKRRHGLTWKGMALRFEELIQTGGSSDR